MACPFQVLLTQAVSELSYCATFFVEYTINVKAPPAV